MSEPTLRELSEASKRDLAEKVRLKHGDFFEVRGACYEVTKVSHKGTLFCKPLTGRLIVPRGTATATQLIGARKG